MLHFGMMVLIECNHDAGCGLPTHKLNYCFRCGFKFAKKECEWGHHDTGSASGGWCRICGHFEQCG